MSDNGFLRRLQLKSVLSRIKDRVGSDIASAISESTSSLSSVITSGDLSSVSEAKGYADGLKIIIDSNLSNHTGNTNNPHSVTYNQVGAAAASQTHTESDIIDLGSYANASHSHNLSDINSITASSTEINYLSGATGNIQQQLNSLTTSGTTLTLADLGGASATDLSNHTGNTNNPHSVTYTQVGAAPSSHTHIESDITDLGSYANSSHTHTESDITDLGSYASSSHTHTKSDITDVNDLALASNLSNHTEDTSNPHSVTYTQTGAAAALHTHELTDVTDITATATEVNYLSNSTRNIQTQINDARIYGFFPAWEYQHEYNIEDCIKIPCCKTTQYLECIVTGVSGSCPEWIIEETGEYYKLDEFISVVNGQCIVDGTCVWLVQDIRDARPVGAIDLNIWRLIYKNPLNIWYGLALGDSNVFYSCNADKKSKMSTSEYLKYVRLIKIIISSAIMSADMNTLRLFDLTASMGTGSSKYLQHIAGAALVLDWCFRPFDYLKSENLNNIDERVFDNIIMYNDSLLLDNYNSTFGVSLTKSQIITEACVCKNKIYNNTLEDDKMYLKNNAIGNRYIRYGFYGEFLNAGLPNITGHLYSISGDNTDKRGGDGALLWMDRARYWKQKKEHNDSEGNVGSEFIYFSAQNSNSIYGNSTTVQPNTITAMYCIKY